MPTLTSVRWARTRESKVFINRSTASQAGEKEQVSSLALFILICLMIVALFTSYILQTKKIQAVHETVLSIFGGKAAFIT